MKNLYTITFLLLFSSAFSMERDQLLKSNKDYNLSIFDIMCLTINPIKVRKATLGRYVKFNDDILHTAAANYCSPNTIRWLVYRCCVSTNHIYKGLDSTKKNTTPLNYFIYNNRDHLDVHKEKIVAFFEVGCPLCKSYAKLFYKTKDKDLKNIAIKVLKKLKK